MVAGRPKTINRNTLLYNESGWMPKTKHMNQHAPRMLMPLYLNTDTPMAAYPNHYAYEDIASNR